MRLQSVACRWVVDGEGARLVLIFPIYAVIVGALAMRWRRRWPAFVAVALGVLFPLAGLRLMHSFDHHLAPEHKLILELLWPYVLLLGVGGLYIACLPRPSGPMECKGCRYDMVGSAGEGTLCPECGKPWSGRPPSPSETSSELLPIPSGPPKRRITL